MNRDVLPAGSWSGGGDILNIEGIQTALEGRRAYALRRIGYAKTHKGSEAARAAGL